VEQTLQQYDHVIAATKPVYNGNKLRIERRCSAGHFGESVLDESTCDLSVVIRIARIHDQILELKEKQYHQQRRCSRDSGEDCSILVVLARAHFVDVRVSIELRPLLADHRMRDDRGEQVWAHGTPPMVTEGHSRFVGGSTFLAGIAGKP
jgi:hypothetical protein